MSGNVSNQVPNQDDHALVAEFFNKLKSGNTKNAYIIEQTGTIWDSSGKGISVTQFKVSELSEDHARAGQLFELATKGLMGFSDQDNKSKINFRDDTALKLGNTQTITVIKHKQNSISQKTKNITVGSLNKQQYSTMTGIPVLEPAKDDSESKKEKVTSDGFSAIQQSSEAADTEASRKPNIMHTSKRSKRAFDNVQEQKNEQINELNRAKEARRRKEKTETRKTIDRQVVESEIDHKQVLNDTLKNEVHHKQE